MGLFSADSKATQTTTTVSGTGQLNKKSNVAQGGSVQLGKGAKAGPDFSGIKLAKNAALTINQGPSQDVLASLAGALTRATNDQVTAVQPVVVAPSPVAQTPDATSPTSAPEPAPDNSNKVAVLVVAVVGAFLVWLYIK